MSKTPGWSYSMRDEDGNVMRDRASGKTEDGMFSAELFVSPGQGVVGLLYRKGTAAPVLTLSVAGPDAHPIHYAFAHAADRMRDDEAAAREAARWRGRQGQQQTRDRDDCLLSVYPQMGRWRWRVEWSWSDIYREAAGLTDTETEAKQAALNAAKELADGE